MGVWGREPPAAPAQPRSPHGPHGTPAHLQRRLRSLPVRGAGGAALLTVSQVHPSVLNLQCASPSVPAPVPGPCPGQRQNQETSLVGLLPSVRARERARERARSAGGLQTQDTVGRGCGEGPTRRVLAGLGAFPANKVLQARGNPISRALRMVACGTRQRRSSRSYT